MSSQLRPLIAGLMVAIALLVSGVGLVRAGAAPAATTTATAGVRQSAAHAATPAAAASATASAVVPQDLLNALGATPGEVTATTVPHLSRLASSGQLVSMVTDISQGWVGAVTRSGAIAAAQYRPTASVPNAGTPGATSQVTGLTGLLAIARARGVSVTDVSGTPPLVPGTASGGSSSGLWTQVALFGAPLVLLVMLMVLMRFRRGASGGGDSMSSISSHGKIRSTSKVPPSRVRFADVAGVDEAVEELRETVAFLKEPERFADAGARMPRGVILYGPPGTGKTMLASAVSGEAGVPYYSLSGSEFVESLVGVGASRVRDLFVKARKNKAGAVIFIDEIDAVGRKRGSLGGGGNDERETTLNQLLVELDGFSPRDRIVVIAATNRVELLDDALTRPGRFDRHIQVSLPAERGRRAILAVHSANKRFSADANLDHIAAITAGFSGADLAKLLNEAAIMSVRGGRPAISNEDLAEGMLRVVAGPERKDRALAAGERERIAWHEAGHALAADLCPTHPKVQRMTILARGMAAGLALFGDTDSAMLSPQELHERMIVALAGRAAEQVRFGTISSGAANDLEQVNRLARQAVERLGFAPQVGQIVTSVGEMPLTLAESTRREIDLAVGGMVDAAYTEALELLQEHRSQLDQLAAAVLEHEQLDREALTEVLWEIQHPDQRRVPALVRALPTDRPAPDVEPAQAAPVTGHLERERPRSRRPRRARDPRPRPAAGAVLAARAIAATAAALVPAAVRQRSRRSATG
jgi:cell division protease FtsH